MPHKHKDIIKHDVIHYYQYLPALIDYHDLSLEFARNNWVLMKDKFWPRETEDGSLYIKTTMGMALLYSPFYLIAEGQAILTNQETDGFSQPYLFWLLFSSLFYVVIGFIFLRKTLLLYFSEAVTGITIALLYAGTNLLYYTTFSSPMPHAYLFFLFSVFIYYTIKWHEKPSVKNSIVVGLSLSLISLTRPSDAIIVLFFIFYDVTSLKSITKKVQLYLSQWKMILLITVVSFTFWIPQIIYWKMITGSFIYFSYGEEKFFFSNPKIFEVLFGYRKGLFVYTPLMFVAFTGILLLVNKLKEFFLPILLFFIVNIYLISSWWCWWYGGGYGSRVFIESLALLSIPLALFISYGLNKGLFLKIITIIIWLLFMIHQSFQVTQYRNRVIHYDSMTKDAYWAAFLKLSKPKGFWKLLEYPDYGSCMLNNDYATVPKVIKKKKGNIKSNGKYVSCDLRKNRKLYAHVDFAFDWELYYIEYLDNGGIRFKNFEDIYVSVGTDGFLEATNKYKNINNHFILEKIDKTHFRLKTIDNKYFSVNPDTKQLFVTDNNDFEKSIFEIIVLN